MTTFLIVTAWLASLALVGWRVKRTLDARWVERVKRARDDARASGYDAGKENGSALEWRRLIGELGGVLADYPTSRGLRAAIRALGGTVPPLPRRKGAAK